MCGCAAHPKVEYNPYAAEDERRAEEDAQRQKEAKQRQETCNTEHLKVGMGWNKFQKLCPGQPYYEFDPGYSRWAVHHRTVQQLGRCVVCASAEWDCGFL